MAYGAGLTALGLAAAACDDNDPITAPIGNQPPAISISSSTSFGIARLTTFTLNAAAADLNGNPFSVRWSFSDGTTGAGTTLWRTFPEAGTIEVTATATDHLGASSTSNVVTITIGSPTGDWSGTMDLSACEAGTKPVSATFSQSGAAVTGTITLPEGLCNSTPGVAAIGSGEPGRVFASGAVRIRAVAPSSFDVWFEGQMDSAAQQITGTLTGIEPSGMSFTLSRQ